MMTIRQLMRSVFSIVAFLYIALGMPAAVLALLLVINGETTQGRIFGLAAILIFPIPILLYIITFLKKRARWYVAAAFLLLPAVALLLTCYRMAPDGLALPGARADSVFTGTATYRRASAANLVPEIDQLKLGSYVVPIMDPFIDAGQAREIRRLFLGLYRDMGESEEFNRLGSVFNYIYRDAFLFNRPSGHIYQYIPRCKKADGKLPVILFLHGSFGNFKGYLWLWKRFADEHGYAVVAPSFGMGNWYLRGGVGAVEHARQYCLEHELMDGERIYLAGISNGGTGISRAASKNPAAYKGLIFISPIMEKEVLLTERFTTGWQNRPILVLHGEDDRRIPSYYVKDAAAALQQHGADITVKSYPKEDHFLLFSQPTNLIQEIAAWLN